MGSSFIYSSAHIGLDSILVRVEADISSGLPKFTIVGLPDAAINESRERIRAAIKNSGFSFPRTKVTVNLAPANIKKQGPIYDLPIALSILAASGVIPNTTFLQSAAFLGELSLEGDVQPVHGSLLAATMCAENKIRSLILANKNCNEASLVKSILIHQISSLAEIVMLIRENKAPKIFKYLRKKNVRETNSVDFSYIKGQEHVKRALEITAAGNHNILLTGPPGSGKTMLARSVPSILPAPTFEEALETTKIYSICGLLDSQNQLLDYRPFRTPHHTSSSVALIGGGTWPRPGEVSLAHNGVLFLDEFPEFTRKTIENLRQPLEDKIVSISRAAGTLKFPADFMLIAAMNPCPCGFLHDTRKPCECTPGQIMKYKQRISGPIIDRIDMRIEVPRVDFEKLTSNSKLETSSQIKSRVSRARKLQKDRYQKDLILTNDQLSTQLISRYCKLDQKGLELIKQAVDHFHLSARAYSRTLKVARTIADLDLSENIKTSHLAEALQYRKG